MQLKKDRQTTLEDEQKTISFCLPVYNVADYIDDCITSIVSQNLPSGSYEIICVDDKSTDNSFERVNELAKRYPQIKIAQNAQNSGVSFTRNECIKLATMAYIWFLDPDDMLMPNVAADIINKAVFFRVSALLCDFVYIPESVNWSGLEQRNHVDDEPYLARKDDCFPKDKNGHVMCAVWCGLWHRMDLFQSGVRFKEGMIAQEDTLFYYETMQHLDNIWRWPVPCVAYRQRASSVMHQKSEYKNKAYYTSMRIMLETYLEYKDLKNYHDEEELSKKIHHSQENCAMCLAKICDTQFVKTELKVLRDKGIYPYKIRKECLKGKEGFIRKINKYLLPLTPVFWLSHYAWKVFQERIQKIAL